MLHEDGFCWRYTARWRHRRGCKRAWRTESSRVTVAAHVEAEVEMEAEGEVEGEAEAETMEGAETARTEREAEAEVEANGDRAGPRWRRRQRQRRRQTQRPRQRRSSEAERRAGDQSGFTLLWPAYKTRYIYIIRSLLFDFLIRGKRCPCKCVYANSSNMHRREGFMKPRNDAPSSACRYSLCGACLCALHR